MSEALLEIYDTLDDYTKQEVDNFIRNVATRKSSTKRFRHKHNNHLKFSEEVAQLNEKFYEIVNAPEHDAEIDKIFNNRPKDVYVPKENIW